MLSKPGVWYLKRSSRIPSGGALLLNVTLKVDYMFFLPTRLLQPVLSSIKVSAIPGCNVMSSSEIQLPKRVSLFQHASTNIDKFESRAPLLIIISSVSLTFMIFCLVIRMYTKLYIAHKLTWDDGEFVSRFTLKFTNS